MTVETTQPAGDTTPAADAAAVGEQAPASTEAPAETQPRTVEEVEASWQHRQAQSDKAHAAESKVLRDQLASLQAAEDGRRREAETQRQASMTAEQRVQDQINTLTQQLEEKDRNHVVELRTIRFPNIAAELDAPALAVMDEAKLAALEAKLTGQAGSPPQPSATSLIDPNSVTRQNGTPAQPREKTLEELRADLERDSPAFLEELKGR